MDLMSSDEIREKLKKGYENIEAEKVYNAADAFAHFREKH